MGDESAYVKAIAAVVVEETPRIRSYLSTTYFQMFTMKLATALLDALLAVSVFACM